MRQTRRTLARPRPRNPPAPSTPPPPGQASSTEAARTAPPDPASAPPLLAPAASARARSLSAPEHPFWRWLLLACALATALPLWLTKHLPFTDLPQHAAAISSLRHWFDPAFRVQEHFTLALSQTQYLLYYVLGALLAFPFGTAERANLVLLSLIAIGFPYSLRSLLRALEFDERLALFGVTLFWSQTLLIGFFNYLAAMPMLLYALALAVRLARAPTRRLQIELGLLSLALFYMHLSAFLFFAPAAGFALLMVDPDAAPAADVLHANDERNRQSLSNRAITFLRSKLPGFWWTLPSIAAALLFLLKSPVVRPETVGWSQPMNTQFEEIEKALKDLPDALLNIWQGPQDEWCLMALLVAAALLAWPGVREAEPPGLVRRRSLAALWLSWAALLYFAFPVSIGWLWQLNERYALVFALLAPLLLRPARGLRSALPLLLVAGTGLFAAGNAAGEFRLFEREVSHFDQVIEQTEPGKHLLSMIFEQNSRVARFSPFLHYGSYYRARKGGVASFSFAELPQSPLRYIPGMGPPPKPAGWEWHALDYNNAREGPYYDYWLVHGYVDPLARLNLATGPKWKLKVRDGEWALYEKVE